ncbi:hypothetical protein Taro_035854 [Colocasia esculenta]|uniref:Uncharacterized protein n=1 Tax=Colocasia esculenta TaxID=4460 RepID=A0A843W014_COLES|nr:hypothetical protein [Colocasia esculenta]
MGAGLPHRRSPTSLPETISGAVTHEICTWALLDRPSPVRTCRCPPRSRLARVSKRLYDTKQSGRGRDGIEELPRLPFLFSSLSSGLFSSCSSLLHCPLALW